MFGSTAPAVLLTSGTGTGQISLSSGAVLLQATQTGVTIPTVTTVGTVTEIYDYLRLLFARVGRPSCFQCGEEITAQTVQQMVDAIGLLPEGSKFQLLAPIVRGRKGEYRKELLDMRRAAADLTRLI